ncbi:ATP-binding protein [Spirillospora sp. CA-294931]|uniref:GAF domain-containing sensor histidine kinase n=1 Tax=Spirillospora sp. CA-294931 TaxID=3240042 RepID=UPI003D8FCFD1
MTPRPPAFPRWPRVLAHAGWLSTVVLACATALLAVLTRLPAREVAMPFGAAVMAVAFAGVGTLVALRRPGNPMGWLLSAIGLSVILTVGLPLYARYTLETRPGALPGGELAGWTGLWIWTFAPGLAGTFLLLLFPDGRLPSPRWRPVAWLAAADLAVCAAATAIVAAGFRPPSFSPEFDTPADPLLLGVPGAGFLALFVASAAACRGRYRRARGDERRQLQWFGFSVAIAAAAVAAQFLGDPENKPDPVTSWLVALAIGIPFAIGFAIFKYRLYDIDVVIRKTVVYAVLAGFVTLVYLAVVVGIGALAGTGDGVGDGTDLLPPLLATAVAALGFSSVRDRARRLADRLVYGVRATPYEALSRLSERLTAAYEMHEFLPALTRLLAEATGARRTEVWVRVGAELRRLAVHGEDGPPGATPLTTPMPDAATLPDLPGADLTAPIRNRGELLGAITLTKSPGEALDERDAGLVRDLAAQAAVALRDVMLTAELRASRQRIVLAQDTERRRLERDIHDGAQQNLVALALKLRLARALLDTADPRAHVLLDELGTDIETALATMRDLARGVFPAILTDHGLVHALRAHAASLPRRVRTRFQVDPPDLRCDPEIETAVYFCVREALQNAVKHADDGALHLTLTLDPGGLEFSVADSGPGFDPASTGPGTGLQNIKDRLEALGGTLTLRTAPGEGTTVTGAVTT